MLQHTETWLLVAASISILFFYFAIKVRFAKRPSLKSYALFFYAFIFYSISAISFVVLNAMQHFLHLQDGFYSEFWWFFPINFLAAAIGYLVALIIHQAAVKVAAPYTYKLLNASLVIISFALIFTLLVQPLQTTFQQVLSYQQAPPKPSTVNKIQLTEVQADTMLLSQIAMPSQIFDSLSIHYSQQKIKLVNPANGYLFSVTPLVKPVEQLYVLPLPNYLAILALPPRIQAQSNLILLDSMGVCVYNQMFSVYYNHLGLSPKGFLQLNTRDLNDSLVFGKAFQILN